MLKLLRVDDRLIHGQVAFSWVAATRVNTIVVANDRYATNPMLKMTLSVGKPAGIKMEVIQLSQALDYLHDPNKKLEKVMMIAENIEDACILCEGAECIQDVCLGGVRDAAGKKLVHSQVFLSSSETELIEKMLNLGKHVFAQDVPANKAVEGSDLIKKFKGDS